MVRAFWGCNNCSLLQKHVVLSCLIIQYSSRYSVGNTESSYEMDGPGFFEFWWRKGNFSSPKTSKLALGPLPRVNWYLNSFLGVKRVAHYFNHLPSISTEAKNEWRYPSTSPTCLRGVDRGQFALLWLAALIIL
jgi:hypothetical protein